jgi:hypothetical protein
MSDRRSYAEAEVLSRKEERELRDKLASIGPGWVLSFISYGGGALRAERAGTTRYEQATLTAEALLAVVTEAEARIQSAERDDVVQVHEGLQH